MMEGPSTVALDRSRALSQRAAAVQAVLLSGPNASAKLTALHILVWSDRHPLELRIAAMDRLIEHDAEGFYRAADRWLPTVDDERLVRALGDRAVLADRRDVARAFLRRWSQPRGGQAEPERVEYAFLTELMAGQTIENWLWSEVMRLPGPADASSMVPLSWSAWTVLSRIETPDALRDRVRATNEGSTLLISLVAAAEVLNQLPANAEGLRWLAALQRDAETWSRAEALTPRGVGSEIALRHLPVLIRETVAKRYQGLHDGRAALLDRMDEAGRVQRERPAGLALDLNNIEGELPATDLKVIEAVLCAMQVRGVVAAWFAQADADLADTGSEYGGVLTWADDGSYVAEGYLPQRRQGDQKFFSPPELIEAMYTGLAHYHFHAQAYYNAEFAGPGRGDLDFTDALGANTLTLTFIDRDRLNVDLALPGRRVIDLGTVRRPEPNGAE